MREYNSAFAFTSLGVHMDDRLRCSRGPSVFTIHGELRHRTGALLPDPGCQASYSQLYIYDSARALDIRQRRNPNLNQDVLQTIQQTIMECNPFTKIYRHAFEILSEASRGKEDNFNIPAYLHYSSNRDKRRYNLPSADEVAVILPGDGTEHDSIRDIVLHLKGGNKFMQISECHPAYLPLHYVLMFPYGELGWSPDMRRNTGIDRLTQMDYYKYLLYQRTNEYSPILRGHKLFQEFIVDAWAATEQNRLRYIRLKQDQIRAELYQGLTDIALEGVNPEQVGKRVVLPASHLGSPRHMTEVLHDSLAITRYFKHPDIFLTMTANPRWPEITDALLPHQQPADRPDLVARVFELKRRALMKEIKKNRVFGRQIAHVFTIEYQKRGLPHMHALIFLAHEDKVRTVAQVDRIVTAEFPDPNTEPELFNTVLTCMVHGPCGVKNPSAPCMEDGRCTKKYPRAFAENTKLDKDGYPIYRRRDNELSYSVKNGKQVDNRDVVPYNPYLSRLFNCHINVEVCASIRAVKYIHKYVYKGHDRTTLVLSATDEIQQYLDARYIGPSEAAWRLFGFLMHQETPSVVRLAVHLPGMHRVVFNATESMDAILRRGEEQKSTLCAFFHCCATDVHARRFTYQEFPEHYVWNKGPKIWTPRKQGFSIGRMYFANPNSGERYYLRLLLTVVKGPTSFDDLRTVDNVVLPTFKDACIARGLLEDDKEWVQCLREAATMKTGYQLRRLFSIILLQCAPTKPDSLWEEFSMDICDDLGHQIRTKFNISTPTDAQITDYGLYLLNELLLEAGQTIGDFPPMPKPVGNWNVVVGNKLLWEQRQLQFDAHTEILHSNAVQLNMEQRDAYEAVNNSVMKNDNKLFFLSGPAGTGKTFVYNTVAATCRLRGDIVIMVASSGIASLLLSGGRTAHSTFQIPLDIMDNSVCGFSKQSPHAALFKETKLIIWDEVPMQHKYCVEAVDRTLRDIRDDDRPFGGITVVLGGDFRQCLPVIPKGVREQIVGACLRRSYLWKHVNVLTLSRNMRLQDDDANSLWFAKFIFEVGTSPNETVRFPSSIKKCESIQVLISTTYPDLNQVQTVSSDYLTERTILSARNDDVNYINGAALQMFPGESVTYLAADKIADKDDEDTTDINRYPNEYLNSLNPAGLPPFSLQIKVGSPIMLLRNLAPKNGMCNGTRLKVKCCMSRCIEAIILTGEKAGESVFIPRISLTPTSFDFPFNMTRRQFPVRLAYAMTINKAQGQSVRYVGIDLRTDVFSHGQLYVALSRCTSAERLNILLPTTGDDSTTNIVYPEVLL